MVISIKSYWNVLIKKDKAYTKEFYEEYDSQRILVYLLRF